MTKAIVGIIGGSGIYNFSALKDAHEVAVSTPWGEPSDPLRIGKVGATDVVFLSRHGRGHRYSPSTINYRANIDAMKRLGVTDIVSLSACGSFRKELHPGLLVIVDQFDDRTYRRENSYFGTGCVAHVPFSHPVAPNLSRRLVDAAAAVGVNFRKGGAYLCMEGPQFSTLSESQRNQAAGADLVGMTAATEAKLAREAEISYALVAMVTDYDCWHEEHGPVDVAAVLKVMEQNAHSAEALLIRFLSDFPDEHEPCPIGSDRALDNAIMTSPEARDPALMAKLDAVCARVLNAR